MSAAITPAQLTATFALVPDQVSDLYAWEQDFRPIAAEKAGRAAALAALAARRGMAYPTVRTKFYAWQRAGITGLIDRRAATQLWETGRAAGLSAADRELVKLWCESFQRKSEPALRALRRAWLEQRVPRELAARGLAIPHTATPIDPGTGYPRGWSLRNLMHYSPSEFELKAARIGRAAAAAHRPLVYTTRRNLYPGQFYLFDDMWHDHEVVDLDQRRRGRPLEFHALDLASACKVAWGIRTRTLRDDGTHEGLAGGDFRFLLASFLGAHGYDERGTTLVVEHGTAAISETLERLLHDCTGGKIKVARSGMTGAAAHAGQYAGRAKGNFRFKAALESLGNLIHNEMAALPGQVGMDRDHCPEQMHDGGRLLDARTGLPVRGIGAQKHTDALLAALSQLPPERVAWIRWDFCTVQQFRLIAEEVYARLNRRTEHDLEGWDDHYIPCERTGRMRRLAPLERWAPARKRLVPLQLDAVMLLLGHEQGVERTTRSGMIELRDGEITGDVIRFDASALPDRAKFLTVLNPFDAARLFCFDHAGRPVAALPRLHSVCRADVEAVQREMGRAAATESALLAPLRARHIAEAREKAARHAHNSEVLRGPAAPVSELAGEDADWTPEPGPAEDDAGAMADEIADLL